MRQLLVPVMLSCFAVILAISTTLVHAVTDSTSVGGIGFDQISRGESDYSSERVVASNDALNNISRRTYPKEVRN
jgi:hypothetical protein